MGDTEVTVDWHVLVAGDGMVVTALVAVGSATVPAVVTASVAAPRQGW